MSAKRTRIWKHVDGQGQTSSFLFAIFKSCLVAIVDFEYLSDCMKTGLCCKSIKQNVPVIKKFIELDPRGAYFGQIDMFNAFDMALADDDDMRAKLYAKATPEMEHAEEVVRLTVYKLRVVFSYLRIAYDNGFDDEHELMLNDAPAMTMRNALTH